MEHLLKTYQRRLINLSSGNKALLLRRLAKGFHLDWSQLSFLQNVSDFGLLKQLLSGIKTIPISPFADPRQAGVAAVSRQLQFINRQANLLQQERGSADLYVGWPFVQGKFNDGSPAHCPLLFFPVSLELNVKQQWVLNSLAPAFLNKNFLLAYAHFNQTIPDEALLSFDAGTFPKDALAFRTELYEVLKKSGLEINFNRELFEDKILPFQSLTKDDLGKKTKPGELKLFPEAVLGIFPQASSFLMADYDAILAQPKLPSFEEIFKTNQEVQPLIKANSEQNAFAVFDLDAAQEHILQRVKSGESVVVQGPPGTGKSQLICNLITDFAARRKTVWVVCQKRAALEVVQKRLASKGLENFAVLIHDAGTDRRRIFDQIRFQIEEAETYKKQNNSLTIVFAERAYLEISRRINAILQTLTDYKTALFDVSECGWPVKALYLRSNLQQNSIGLGENYKLFTAETLPIFLPKLTSYLTGAQQFDHPDFSLKDRKSFANWNWPERKKLEGFAAGITNFFGRNFLDLPLKIQNQNSTKYAAFQSLLIEKPALSEFQKKISNPVIFAAFSFLFSGPVKVAAEVKTLLKNMEKMIQGESAGLLFFTPEQYALAEKTIADFETAQQNIFRRTAWNLRPENKKKLQQLFQKFGLRNSETNIENLKIHVERYRVFQQSLQQLSSLVSFPESLNCKTEPELENTFSEIKTVLELVKNCRELVKKNWLIPDVNSMPSQIQKLLFIASEFEEKRKDWLQVLTGKQLEKLAEDSVFQTKILALLQQHFDEIVAHDTLWESFSGKEKAVIKALQQNTEVQPETLRSIFENSVFLSWIYFLEQKFPVLKLASGNELTRLEEELQNLIHVKQNLSHEIVLSRLREKTYQNLEKNRLGNVVSYRRLLAQVSKKRGLYSLRKLQANFADEIADLVPIWLASPETISAVFPLSQQPDLVIFDEASQAFAEAGLPAIFRAKQVVITGDSAQLQPSDVYRSRWNSDNAEEEELTVESLLDLGSLYLPQYWLTQHYRSRFPELIQFSNQHFYRNKLELIPTKEDLENNQPAIEFVKVNGLWKDQTNREEADKITQLLFSLLASGISDIGVISFNFAQQQLIQDLCEAKAAASGISLPESVLIKNIENMQGDEKQVIIFSIGYAPDETGNLRLNFGSLNQAHGANRLNVAITRAIEKIYVVSSINGEQLATENAKNSGPELLKKYLQYARLVSEGKFKWQLPEAENLCHPFLLKDKLKAAFESNKNGTELVEKLPFIDLVLQKYNDFCSLIRTDDALYFSHISARQTHADLPAMLQKRNWPHITVYSRQFWQNPQNAMQHLEKLEC